MRPEDIAWATSWERSVPIYGMSSVCVCACVCVWVCAYMQAYIHITHTYRYICISTHITCTQNPHDTHLQAQRQRLERDETFSLRVIDTLVLECEVRLFEVCEICRRHRLREGGREEGGRQGEHIRKKKGRLSRHAGIHACVHCVYMHAYS